jgi:hydrogenase-4 component F
VPESEPEPVPVAAGAAPPERNAPPAPATAAPTAERVVRGEPSAWMVAPVAAGMLVLLLLGLHPPADLTDLFTRAVALLLNPGA